MIPSYLLIGLGTIFIALGVLFLKTHYTTISPNEELEWMGYGDHPFRKQ